MATPFEMKVLVRKDAGALLGDAAYYAVSALRFAVAWSIVLDDAALLAPDLKELGSLQPAEVDVPSLIEDLVRLAEHGERLADGYAHREVRRRAAARSAAL